MLTWHLVSKQWNKLIYLIRVTLMFIDTDIKLVETGFQLAQADFPRPNSLKQIMSSFLCDRLLFSWLGVQLSLFFTRNVAEWSRAAYWWVKLVIWVIYNGLLHVEIFHLVGKGRLIPIIDCKTTVYPYSVISHFNFHHLFTQFHW